MKLASSFASNVVGMMQYFPGFNLARPAISRILMYDGDVATGRCFVKNDLSSSLPELLT